MNNSNNRTGKISLRLMLTLVVLGAIALPFVASAFAADEPELTEGFLNPFDLSVSPFTMPASFSPELVSVSSAPSILATTVSSPVYRAIRIPYRPRPRSPIIF
jgi:hypothetical protein